jgi:hypothetical protein
VDGEEPVDFGQGIGQAARPDHDRGTVPAGFDPQHQVAVLEELASIIERSTSSCCVEPGQQSTRVMTPK